MAISVNFNAPVLCLFNRIERDPRGRYQRLWTSHGVGSLQRCGDIAAGSGKLGGQTHVALSYVRGVSRSSVTSFDAFDLSEFCLPDSADLFWTSAAVCKPVPTTSWGLTAAFDRLASISLRKQSAS